MISRHLLLIILVSLLAGCAGSSVFDTTKVVMTITPRSVAAKPDVSLGKTVLWGGSILDVRNLKESTEIEVLAYPLNRFHRPLVDSEPQGRFIIRHMSYLEPTAYARDRLLSVVGTISGSQAGKVGESPYTYPVINSEQLHLWTKKTERTRTSLHFGVGIGL